MSMILEILGCILCCEEEIVADGDDHETSYDLLESGSRFCNYLFRRNTAPPIRNRDTHQSHSTSITITDEPNYRSSFLDTSSRKPSNPCPSPSITSIPNRIIISSGTGSTASVGSAHVRSTERINEVSQTFKDLNTLVHRYSDYTPPLTSKPPQSLPKPPLSCSSQFLLPSVTSPKPPPSCLISSPSVPKASTSLSKSSTSVPKASTSLSKPTPLVPKPATTVSKPPPLSPKPPSSSSFGSISSSPKPSQSYKVTLSPASSSQTGEKNKMKYVLHGKDPVPIYIIPEDIKDLIEKDKVPGVLFKPLSPSTYRDYFAALLYAEDHYIEKWNDFLLVNVTVKLQEAAIYRKSGNKRNFHENDEKKSTLFAAFEVDSIPERRPFLLSRDFVFAKPTGRRVDPFQGIIYRVMKSTTVLVEFEEDFYSQHHQNRNYDISFSFNRVCLKRAHQAVSAASDPLFQGYLFPDRAPRKNIPASASLLSGNFKLDSCQNSAVHHILNFQGPPPYLVEGPLSVYKSGLSKSGLVVQEAVCKIYKGSPQSRILICSPINSTCDVLMRSLKGEIPESHMFRANAAFREIDGVPADILSSSLYKDECFSCPSLQELRKFRLIFSTFVSSFRLRNEGITAGHFSHIFLVDASSVTEPETMIALSNLANEKTAVIVTGAPRNQSGWVRSNIARKQGLKVSYFERLLESKRYSSLDPMFITQLVNSEQQSFETYSFMSYS